MALGSSRSSPDAQTRTRHKGTQGTALATDPALCVDDLVWVLSSIAKPAMLSVTPVQLESRNIPNPLCGWLCQDDKTSPDPALAWWCIWCMWHSLALNNKSCLYLYSPFITASLELERPAVNNERLTSYSHIHLKVICSSQPIWGSASRYLHTSFGRQGISRGFCDSSKVTQQYVED